MKFVAGFSTDEYSRKSLRDTDDVWYFNLSVETSATQNL